jgi:hypothetical protein
MRDRDRKGRLPKGKDHWAYGRRNRHNAKLTEDAVRKIRYRASAGEEQKIIAHDFGVSTATVSHIVTRRTWRHVD